jgi:hypothetical protein
MKYLDQYIRLAILCSNGLAGWRPGAETCSSLILVVNYVLRIRNVLGTSVGQCIKDEQFADTFGEHQLLKRDSALWA